jgi:glycosyltransferase involved in cell wall biosynthesis
MIALAYVSNLVPDNEVYANAALSRSANMFSGNLVEALAEAGIRPDILLSARPIPAFPRSPQLLLRSGSARLSGGGEVRLLPFVNLKIAKHLTVGFSVMFALWRWSIGLPRDAERVVVLYNVSFPPGLAVLTACRLINATAIAIVNDLDLPGGRTPDNIMRRLDVKLQRWIVRGFDALQVCTASIARRLAPELPYIVVEGGVSPEVKSERAAASGNDQRAAPNFTVMYAGVLSQWQGTDLLLDAFAHLSSSFRLVLAGYGPLTDRVVEAAARDSRVTFLGYLPMENLAPFYALADLFVCLPPVDSIANQYAFPSKLIDYVASGKAVIATRLAHIESEFGEYVHLLDGDQPASLAELIRQVAAIDPAMRAEHGRRAREFALREKSWEAQARKLVRLIRSANAQRRSFG